MRYTMLRKAIFEQPKYGHFARVFVLIEKHFCSSHFYDSFHQVAIDVEESGNLRYGQVRRSQDHCHNA